MFIYIAILFMMCFLMVKYDFNQKVSAVTSHQEVTSQYIVVIVLILLAGLRNRVGGDTINYEMHFIEYPNMGELFNSTESWEGLSQPIWFLINVTLKTLWNNFLGVQIFHAILFNCLLFRFVRRSTTKVFTAFTVMYCMVWWNFNFEILRESLCVVLFLNGVLCLKEKKVKKYFLWCFPALGIHYFAFVMVFLALLFYWMSNKLTVIIVVLSILFILCIDTTQLSDMIFKLSLAAGDINEETLESYIYGDKYGSTSLNIFGVIFFLITLTLPIILAIKYKESPYITRIICLFIIIAVVKSVFPIISRLSNYLWPILIIIAINYLYTVKLKCLYGIAVFSLLVYNVVNSTVGFYKPSFLLNTNMTYDCRYIPYTSVFQSPDPVRESYYGKD